MYSLYKRLCKVCWRRRATFPLAVIQRVSYFIIIYIHKTKRKYIKKWSGGRVVWIGFWSRGPAHTSHSFASRERFQGRAGAASVGNRTVSAVTDVSCVSVPLWPHGVCALAHLDQMMSCKDSYWLLSQTFPEMICGVTGHSARDLYSELPPAPEEKVLIRALYTACEVIIISIMVVTCRNLHTPLINCL